MRVEITAESLLPYFFSPEYTIPAKEVLHWMLGRNKTLTFTDENEANMRMLEVCNLTGEIINWVAIDSGLTILPSIMPEDTGINMRQDLVPFLQVLYQNLAK